MKQSRKFEINFCFIWALVCFLIFTFITKLLYRFKCYYVQTVFLPNSSLCSKISTIFSTIFCCYTPQAGTIVDHNSMFIIHSLATYNDFIDIEEEIDLDKQTDFGDGYQSNKEDSFMINK